MNNSRAEQPSRPQLEITDVYMKGAEIFVSDAFDPRTVENEMLAQQFFQYVRKSELLVDQSSTPVETFLRVFIEVGFRSGYMSDEHSQKDAGTENFDELVRIKATYVVEYQVESEPSEDEIDKFALSASMYHVWPYWREYVAQSCRRAAFGSVTIPLLQPGSYKQPGHHSLESDSAQPDGEP
jgi:hypothetical protein